MMNQEIIIDPLHLFNDWLKEEFRRTKVSIPSACCLSTIGLDGFPNARFVSLKELAGESFIVTGPLSSRKGLEIRGCDRVALTFWWTETERQVRVQGIAKRIPDPLADKYFSERDIDSRISSIVSDQGKDLPSKEALIERFYKMKKEFTGTPLRRPSNWGGFEIQPVRIEFLEFDPSRLHRRTLFQRENDGWTSKEIQP